MTLTVTSSAIQIKNAVGAVKFDSTNRLVYNKYYQEGTITLYGDSVSIPFQPLTNVEDILVITVRINSCNGLSAVTDNLIGLDIPANRSILIDFNPRLTEFSNATTDTEIFGVNVVKSNLIFRGIRGSGTNYTQIGSYYSGTRTTNITYKARILSYL